MRIGDTIYLDHQASAPVDPRVLAEMTPFWREQFGNPHSSDHAAGWQAAKALSAATAAVGDLIGADEDEIVFTSGATEANNLALFGIALGLSADSGRERLLVSAIEHKCVLAAARALEERHGFAVERIPVGRDGLVELDALRELMDARVALISVMAVNNEVGSIQDIAAVADICREAGALLHCDAAQAPCATDLRSITDHVDLLSLSGHKMYGPKGIGALFLRRALHDGFAPLIHGGGQQNNLRSGTVPVPLCVGMGAAAKLCKGEGGQAERKALRRRRDRFIELLGGLDCVTSLNGPGPERRHPGNANIRFEGIEAHDLLAALQPRLAASTGSACTSGITEPSHVLRAMGLSADAAEQSIRFSLGRETTDADIEEAVELIADALSRLDDSGAVSAVM